MHRLQNTVACCIDIIITYVCSECGCIESLDYRSVEQYSIFEFSCFETHMRHIWAHLVLKQWYGAHILHIVQAYAFWTFSLCILRTHKNHMVLISSTSQSRNPTPFDSQTSRLSSAYNTDLFLFVPVEMALTTERHTSFSKQKLNGRRSLYDYSSIVEDLLAAHKVIAAFESR